MTDQLNERLREKITKIVFENGGTVEPLVDKLLNLVKQEVTKARIDELGAILSIFTTAELSHTEQIIALQQAKDRMANLQGKK